MSNQGKHIVIRTETGGQIFFLFDVTKQSKKKLYDLGVDDFFCPPRFENIMVLEFETRIPEKEKLFDELEKIIKSCKKIADGFEVEVEIFDGKKFNEEQFQAIADGMLTTSNEKFTMITGPQKNKEFVTNATFSKAEKPKKAKKVNKEKKEESTEK